MVFGLESDPGDLYPTVYALWRLPHLVPYVGMPACVFPNIESGADVMLPGVCEGLRGSAGEMLSWRLGDKRALVAIDDAPEGQVSNEKVYSIVGIGTMACVPQQAAGRKGKCLKMLHSYRDSLWVFGDRSAPPQWPSRLPPPEPVPLTPEATATAEGTVENAAAAATAIDCAANTTDAATASEAEPHDEVKPTPVPAAAAVDTAEMDKLIRRACYNALKGLKDSSLPLLASTFYASNMLPARPAGSTLDLKHSSYKKVGTLLQELEHAGIVKLKTDKRGTTSIAGISRDSNGFLQLQKEARDAERQCGAEPDEAVAEAPVEECESAQQQLVEDVFKAPKPVVPFIVQMGGDAPFYSLHELDTLLRQRVNLIEAKGMSAGGATVLLDECLAGALAVPVGRTLGKGELLPALLKRLQPYHILNRNDIPEPNRIRSGKAKPVVLTVERVGSNKKITVVSGLEAFGESPSELAGAFQRKFAASCSVRAGSGAVCVQGNFVTEIAAFLTAEVRIPKKYIEFDSKLAKKATKGKSGKR
eukprot:TRINITY_DN307_c0_g1_i1.p1 TRINITY_DN307_c0_g1~~TRINITY_DN307_c0_g1_i1.p1  ORF type:complete len:600 (+),score=145.99 TRINITY_DN307_c0_g1_i1:205-1800(+)